MSDLRGDELQKLENFRDAVSNEFQMVLGDIKEGKRRYNERELNDKILDEVIISWNFRELFKPLLKCGIQGENFSYLTQIRISLDDGDASAIFNNERNAIYFIKHVIPKILSCDMVDKFSEIGIKLDFGYVQNNKNDKFGGDFALEVSFEFENLKLDLNYNYLKQFMNFYVKSAIYKFIRKENIRPEYRKAVAMSFDKNLLEGFAYASEITNSFI